MAGDRIVVGLVRIIGFIFRVIPFSWGLRIASTIGTLLFWLEPKRKFIGFANMSQTWLRDLTVEQRLKTLRRLYQNLAISFVEVLRFPELTSAEIQERIEFDGAERMRPFIQQPDRKAFIVLAAHYGNWELMNQAFALVGFPTHVVVRAQKITQLNRFLNEYRELHGSRTIKKGMQVREIFGFIQRGEAIAMAIDQDGGKRGIFSPLFGRPVSTKPGAFYFSMKTQTPLIPLFIIRDSLKRDRHTLCIEEPISPPQRESQIPAAIEQYLKLLEKYIVKAPDQWLWLHNRWKSSPIQNVIILSDGKKGHVKQSAAVAELTIQALRQEGKVSEAMKTEIVEVRFKSDLRRIATNLSLTLFPNSIVLRWKIFKWGLIEKSYEALACVRADVIISAGSSLSAVNAWLAKTWHARNLHLMKPNLVSWKKFKKIILPQHDWKSQRPPPKNVILTKMTPSCSIILSQSKDDWIAQDKLRDEAKNDSGERIGILLGGDNHEYRMDSDWVARLLDEVLKGTKKKILLTTSRRTSGQAESIVEKKMKGHAQCGLLEIANHSHQNGVIEKILQDSDIILVTGESMSMISEAVSSGKPVVVVFPPAKRQGVTKHLRMAQDLEKQGFIKRVELNQVAESLAVPVIESEITQKLLNEERERLLEGLRGFILDQMRNQ